MILDAKLKFSDSQAVTVTADSANVLDNQKGGDALGEENLYLVIQTKSADVAAVGAATVTFDLVTDDDVAFGAPVTIYSSGAIPKASMTKNKAIIKTPLPLGVKRYLKIVYTVATGPLTAGAFDAFLTPNIEVK